MNNQQSTIEPSDVEVNKALELVAQNGQKIIITAAAGEKFAELSDSVNEDEIDKKSIRIFVSGGGCSGMQYGMTYADNMTKFDHLLKAQSANSDTLFEVVIDAVALDYMNKAEIDYEDNGISATFVFNNVFESLGGSGSCGGCGSAS